MTRLTQEELSEPDVTLVMTRAQFDALPREVYELLRLFIGHDDGRRTGGQVGSGGHGVGSLSI